MQTNCNTTPHNSKRHSSVVGIQTKYLSSDEFSQANAQKRMWLKAAIQECGLRGNEIPVLEALVFLTDPRHGDGKPSIGAIQEKVLEKTSSIHRDTVSQCLKRLQQKGAITKTQRGKKQTNLYRLIGFEYKSESCYRESRHSLNSALSSKRGREQQSVKNKDKTQMAPACARPWVPEKELELTLEEKLTGIEKLKQMRAILAQGKKHV